MLVFTRSFGTPFIKEVSASQDGMFENHPWAAVAHNLDDSFLHRGFVAVNTAGAAGRLILLKNAGLQAFDRILVQFMAGLTKLFAFAMMSPAENLNHGSDRLELSLQARVNRRGFWIIPGVH
jgi:hypothetical protein